MIVTQHLNNAQNKLQVLQRNIALEKNNGKRRTEESRNSSSFVVIPLPKMVQIELSLLHESPRFLNFYDNFYCVHCHEPIDAG